LSQGRYSSRSVARLKDGDTKLAERPKVAGAQAVAAGSNNEDAWQIDRGQKNATARAGRK